jgi:hypothetical protein
MKKVLVVGALAIFALASCKKDYTCACKFSDSATLNIPIAKAKKKDAESTCASAETAYKINDAGVKCSI